VGYFNLILNSYHAFELCQDCIVQAFEKYRKFGKNLSVRREFVRKLKYSLLALWLASLLITIKVYRQNEYSVAVSNPVTKKITYRTIRQGYTFQQILAIYLAIGICLYIGSLFLGAPPEPPRRRNYARVQQRSPLGPRLRSAIVEPFRCPKCLSLEVRRSRRHELDWVLALLLIFPYRCHGCLLRFYRFVPWVKLKSVWSR
jgi:hypothetical protein